MSDQLQNVILRAFFTNEEYMRKVIPFIEPRYFEGVHQPLFKEYAKYVAKYNNLPSQEAFRISLSESETLTEEMYSHALDILPSLFERDTETELNWLVDQTEKWCQDRALFGAVMESISIIDGKHKTLTKGALPDILSKALAVTFDTNIGHDYLADAEERYRFYHETEERLPFDLDYLNKITKGGLPNKSLNIILAGTGVGKSLFMCHCAAGALSQGKNVLYITLEMAEERIAERIDANLLDVSLDQIETLPRDTFINKVKKIESKTQGKLIIKEYPTGSAHSAHFRALLNELKLKKKFTPDIVFIDYLNICTSSRMRGVGGSINTYSYIKAIAEELRGLAVEFNLPIMSATQTTRSGFSSSDPGLEDTSESFGLPATADLMLALVSNDELQALNQILVKQLKNRYADPNVHKRFVIGVDRSKMRLSDVENPEKDLVNDVVEDDGPVFDNTPSGKKLNTEGFQI
jgi:archaellum biogenesis ATPase FlaH